MAIKKSFGPGDNPFGRCSNASLKDSYCGRNGATKEDGGLGCKCGANPDPGRNSRNTSDEPLRRQY